MLIIGIVLSFVVQFVSGYAGGLRNWRRVKAGASYGEVIVNARLSAMETGLQLLTIPLSLLALALVVLGGGWMAVGYLTLGQVVVGQIVYRLA